MSGIGLNTGQRDSKGRAIFRGPRGGLYVETRTGQEYLSEMEQARFARLEAKNAKQVRRERLGGALLAGLAAKKFRRFKDPITHAQVNIRDTIRLNQQRYSKKAMKRYVENYGGTVPMTRRPLTDAEKKAIGVRRNPIDRLLRGPVVKILSGEIGGGGWEQEVSPGGASMSKISGEFRLDVELVADPETRQYVLKTVTVRNRDGELMAHLDDRTRRAFFTGTIAASTLTFFEHNGFVVGRFPTL